MLLARTPHTPTPAPTARGQRAPAAGPDGGQPEEGERLTPDTPHNGGRQPPRGRGWGEGNLQASLGMHDPNPMKSKTSS